MNVVLLRQMLETLNLNEQRAEETLASMPLGSDRDAAYEDVRAIRRTSKRVRKEIKSFIERRGG